MRPQFLHLDSAVFVWTNAELSIKSCMRLDICKGRVVPKVFSGIPVRTSSVYLSEIGVSPSWLGALPENLE